MWYVLQTITGSEKELVDLIYKLIPHDLFDECFIMQRESLKKVKGRYHSDLIPMFPSYVFLKTDEPMEIFYELKKIPMLSRLLKDWENEFLKISEEEQTFLENLQSGNFEHIVQRSLVETDQDGRIVNASGAVGIYKDKIVKQRLRKRYVLIEQEFLGVTRKIKLSIKLKEDV